MADRRSRVPLPGSDRWDLPASVLAGDWARRASIGAAAVLVLGGAAAGYAYAVEPRRLQTIRYHLGVANLPAALRGVRIAHLTDFHVGMEGTRRSTLRRAIDQVRSEGVDLAALTGDFTHNGVWERGADLFRPLTEVCPTYAVLGNHDHLANEVATQGIVRRLREQGVCVLRNQNIEVPVRQGSGHILIVAVDDPRLGYDDLSRAMRGVPLQTEPDRPAILLGHVPDIVEQAPTGRFALTLAGHTHGGQLRFSPLKRFTPLELPMIAGDLDSHYPRGTHVVNGNPLFVNNGLGVSGVPFRFLAPPQVAFFTLTDRVDEEKDIDDPDRYFIEVE